MPSTMFVVCCQSDYLENNRLEVALINGQGVPVLYPTERAAQIDVAEDIIQGLQEFLAGQREFDEADSDLFVCEVQRQPDGSLVDTECGTLVWPFLPETAWR